MANFYCFDDTQTNTACVDMGGGKSSCTILQELSPPLTCTHGGEPVVCQSEMVVLNDQGGRSINVENDLSPTLRAETHGHLPIIGEIWNTLK